MDIKTTDSYEELVTWVQLERDMARLSPWWPYCCCEFCGGSGSVEVREQNLLTVPCPECVGD